MGKFDHQSKSIAMKKIFPGFIVAVILVCMYQYADGQARLRITRLDNYPELPFDTAIQGQIYPNIHIHVKNVGNSTFWGDIHAFLYSQSLGSGSYDTLRDDPFHTNIFIPAGDSVTLQANPNYSFRAIHYAAGDNIVVVWPFSGTTLFDSHQTNVFFSITTGMFELSNESPEIYPNPVSTILTLNYHGKNKVEQVRIYDLVGREVFVAKKALSTIDLTGFREGVYFLELMYVSGERSIKKIIVTTK